MNRFPQFRELWLLTMAHFRELLREPGVIFWGIVFPILMSIGLGLAFTKKADSIRKVAVIRDDRITSAETGTLQSFLTLKCEIPEKKSDDDPNWKYEITDSKLGKTTFIFYELSWDEAVVQLKRGTFNLILKSNKGDVEYHFDPVDSDAELTYLKLSGIIGTGNIIPADRGSSIKPLTVTGTRYIDFLIPGLITMGIMMSTMWGISYGIIEKRSKKLLRRLVATPMRKSNFLISLIAVRITMNFIEALVITVFAILAFKMSVQGSIPALLLLFLSGNIAFAGLSIFISSHTSKTEVGNGLINAVVMPMMVLSGIFFSYQNFPEWSLPVIRNLPLTMLTDGMRSIFNEGAGWNEVALPILILGAIGTVFFVAGLKIFKWH